MRWETFKPLDQLTAIRHAFTLRTVEPTKSDSFQNQLMSEFGFALNACATAEQTHGDGVAIVDQPRQGIAGVDALATTVTNLPLVIRCADCAAIFVVDPDTPAIALIHSGKAGTSANILGKSLASMQRQFGTRPGNCRVVVGPSIGPCHYEVDLWRSIETQARAAGVDDIVNPRVCTACHLDRYFSYRAEKGNTGRMLALLTLTA